MIANRRKEEKTKPAVGISKISNADKSIATSRAKRNAALDARRGITKSNKPTKAKVEEEINKQMAKKNVVQLESSPKKKRVDVKADPQTKAAQRREKRLLARSGAATIISGDKKVVSTLGRPPSKKALKAAIDAMESKGFKMPEGYRMVISFAPSDDFDEDSKPAAKADGGKKGFRKKSGKK